MTDRYYALTVALERDIRKDDAKHIIDAIRMIKGVIKVTPHVADGVTLMAESRAKRQLEDKILKVFKEE